MDLLFFFQFRTVSLSTVISATMILLNVYSNYLRVISIYIKLDLSTRLKMFTVL